MRGSITASYLGLVILEGEGTGIGGLDLDLAGKDALQTDPDKGLVGDSVLDLCGRGESNIPEHCIDANSVKGLETEGLIGDSAI